MIFQPSTQKSYLADRNRKGYFVKCNKSNFLHSCFYPLSTTFILCHPLSSFSSAFICFHPLSSFVSHFHPQAAPTMAYSDTCTMSRHFQSVSHFHPLSSTYILCHPLSPSFTHKQHLFRQLHTIKKFALSQFKLFEALLCLSFDIF